MRHNLDCLAKICAFTLFVYYSVIDFSCSHIVCLGSVHPKETLVMTKVEVRFGTVLRDIALSVLVRIQCARINIDIRVKLLNRNPEASRLEKLCKGCGNDAFT